MILDILIENNPYQVFIGKNLLKESGSILKNWQGRKAAIITDSRVEKLYLNALTQSLNSANIDAIAFIVPEGERSKNPYQLLDLYDQLIDARIERKDLVIALGGGVVGDLAGFLAATYLRGIDFVQIPTTLLAQVDSSVGGKVAVDLKKGKNLIGTFYHPKLVIADTITLNTLESRQLSAGLAEVVKYGFIKDPVILNKLTSLIDLNQIWVVIDELIESSIKVKRDYVIKDPTDKGLRMELNFGHTIGHALEMALGYEKILHGEGVALGMIVATSYGETIGITPKGTSASLKELLMKLELPTKIPDDIDKSLILDAIFRDKKVADNKVNMIFIEEIGKAMIRPMSKKEIESIVMEI